MNQTDQPAESCNCRTNPTLTAQIGYPVRCPHCPPGADTVPPTHWTKHVQRHHPEHAPAAVPPPADRAGLRESVEEALRDCGVYDSEERMWRSLSPAWIEEITPAVLAVLPEPADRPAVLLGVAEVETRPALDVRPLPVEALVADEVPVDRAALLPVWEAVYEPGNVSSYLIGYANDQDAAIGMAEAWLRSQAEVTGRLEWTAEEPLATGRYDRWFELIERHDGGVDTGPGIVVRRRLADEEQQQPATEARPARGDQFEAWLKTQRDAAADYPEAYNVADGLLDLYRLHADTGTPLDEHVCEARVVGDYDCLEPAPVAPQPAPLRAELKPWQLLADAPDEPLPQSERIIGGRRLAATEQQPAAADTEGPRTVCVCGHTRAEHARVSGRLLCDACDGLSPDACKEFDAL